jgi:Mce-associated membrane protein
VANSTVRGRSGTGTPRQRSVAAAARAAAKRAERANRPEESGDESARQEPAEETRTRKKAWFREDSKAKEKVKEGAGAKTRTTEADAEAAEDGDTAAAAKSSRHRPGLVSAVLAVLVVIGLVAVAVLGWKFRDAGRADTARTEALAAAQKAAPVILSYDYRHLDKDFAAARSHLTGDFREQYQKTTKTVVAPTSTKYQGVVKATVAKPSSGGAPAASVVSATPDKAVVLLFMNQITNSTQVSGPRLDLNRVRMTLVQTSEGWKVSAVDAL